MGDKYVEASFKQTWIRVAGIAKRIKGMEPPPHWRFETEESTQQYLVNDFRFVGQATSENNRPGVNQHAKGDELIAWIALFGSVKVDAKGFAIFEFEAPTSNCPWN